MSDSTPGYAALRGSAALLDLSTRGRIRVTGEDRARLLHAMCTNHVQQMKPGDGIYAFFLDAQGRILADADILCFDDHFLLDTGAVTRESLLSHLDRFIIADDVTLEDVTDQTFCLAIEGPQAVDAGLSAPTARLSSTGAPAVRIYGPVADRDATTVRIEGVGVIAASAEDAETARLRHFVPRYGIDITERSLPQETQQTQALHSNKGCYIGQEIVERIRSRGHLNKLLMGFHGKSMDATSVEKGAKIMFEGKEEAEVSSAAAADGEIFGLAWVRAPHAVPGARGEINGMEVELSLPATTY